MKNSKQKQELVDSIKEMEDVYNDKDTPADIKNSLGPSIKNAKEQLKLLEQAEQQQHTAVTAEKKIAKTAPAKEKIKKAIAKKKATTTVHKAQKRITQKLPSIRSAISKAKAALTKVKGRTARGREADADRKALPPGSRISKSGKPYREYRENRADIQRKKAPYLAEGGTIDTPIEPVSHQVDVFGYQTKHMPMEVANEFKKAAATIDAEPEKDGFYFRNTSEALKEFANMVDTIFMGLEAYNMKMVIAAALYSGAYNYKSGMHVSTDVLVDAMGRILSEIGKSFAKGGRIKSAINRDRAYKSDEPWEKNYQRKRSPRNPRYAADGAVIDDEFHKAIRTFIDELTDIGIDMDGEDEEQIANVRHNLEDALESQDNTGLFHATVQAIHDLEAHPLQIPQKEKKMIDSSINKVQQSLRKFKWFVYDDEAERVIGVFLDTKAAEKFIKEQKEKNPKQILDGYSLTHLKKMGIDPLNSDNWPETMAYGGAIDKAFLGMTLINTYDNLLIANSQGAAAM